MNGPITKEIIEQVKKNPKLLWDKSVFDSDNLDEFFMELLCEGKIEDVEDYPKQADEYIKIFRKIFKKKVSRNSPLYAFLQAFYSHGHIQGANCELKELTEAEEKWFADGCPENN